MPKLNGQTSFDRFKASYSKKLHAIEDGPFAGLYILPMSPAEFMEIVGKLEFLGDDDDHKDVAQLPTDRQDRMQQVLQLSRHMIQTYVVDEDRNSVFSADNPEAVDFLESGLSFTDALLIRDLIMSVNGADKDAKKNTASV